MTHPLLRSMMHRDRGIRTPTSVLDRSTLPALVKPLDQSEEDPLPRIPRQQPINQPPPTPHDLARHLDERRGVQRKSILSTVRFSASCLARCRGDTGTSRGCRPCGSGPRSRHHVRPVADQVVHRRGQRANTALQLGDQVFLVAAIVSTKTISWAVIWRSLECKRSSDIPRTVASPLVDS